MAGGSASFQHRRLERIALRFHLQVSTALSLSARKRLATSSCPPARAAISLHQTCTGAWGQMNRLPDATSSKAQTMTKYASFGRHRESHRHRLLGWCLHQNSAAGRLLPDAQNLLPDSAQSIQTSKDREMPNSSPLMLFQQFTLHVNSWPNL